VGLMLLQLAKWFNGAGFSAFDVLVFIFYYTLIAWCLLSYKMRWSKRCIMV